MKRVSYKAAFLFLAVGLALGGCKTTPESLPMTADTIFDSASLTKVIATTPAIMLLVERGKLRLTDKVNRWIPGFEAHGKGAVTLRHLLTHTSGLRPGISAKPAWSGVPHAIDLAKAERLTTQPDTKFRYSDINFILLGEIVRLASGQRLDAFAAAEIYRPLGMRDTGFLQPLAKRSRTAPTERVDGKILHGIVHDPTSRRMGGVAGHAGLFTTAADLSRFAHMMLNGGRLNGRRILKKETVEFMTSAHTPKGMKAVRGLGWDIDSPYSSPRGNHFAVGGYGHTGWTGGSLWVDPATQTIVILMTSRTHPDGNGNVIALRREVATLTAEALRKFSFGDASGVLNGADVLRQRIGILPKGAKVGLITNHNRPRPAPPLDPRLFAGIEGGRTYSAVQPRARAVTANSTKKSATAPTQNSASKFTASTVKTANRYQINSPVSTHLFSIFKTSAADFTPTFQQWDWRWKPLPRPV